MTAAEGRLAEQKMIRKKMERLVDGKFIARIIGYCQILNSYARASLNSQHVRNFPTTVLASVDAETKGLEDESKNFEFDSDELSFAGIGEPKMLIENLKQGFFTSHVTDKAKQWRAGRVNIERKHRRDLLSNLGDNVELDELHDVLNWRNATDDVTAEDVGEVPIENFSESELAKVKEDLEKICEKLKLNLDDRLRKSELMKVAQNVLTGSFDWYDPDLFSNDQAEHLVSQVSESISKFAEKMGIFWKDTVQENFNEVFAGYFKWLSLCKRTKQTTPSVSDEKLWQMYY